ncbi:T9SS type A sorting domain-containing protein [Marivirga tractuosa]|uniref:T9SS type A sorting domain-containing protein n=1 Tax=Marivirga tractuosa TaxID=1006 RepID=UPI0035D0957B
MNETLVIIEIDPTSGTNQEEVWYSLIEESSGTTIASKEPFFLGSTIETDSLCLVDGATYRFEAYDDGYNSWDNNTYEIFYADGTVIGSGMPNDGGAGVNLQEEFTFTVAIDIESPSNVTASNISSVGFDLSWDNVFSADKYQVYVGLNNDTTSIAENDSLFIVSSDSTTYYQAPQYSELYYYYVRAISSGGDTSSFSTQASIKLPVSEYLVQDSLAMVSFYENANGENWSNNQNWLTGKLNTWEGLSMTNDSLKTINLASNQIGGAVPDVISDLNFINEIDLSNNTITNIAALEPLVGGIGNLNVSRNELSFEELEPFNSLPAFNYNNQNFNYFLPDEYIDFLGADASIHIEAPASSNTFQWFKDSVQIEGETDSVLVLNNLQKADEGVYYVEVGNDLLGELLISSTPIEVKVSSLERDIEALRQFYESTNGENWSSITWDTSSDDPTEWSANEQDVIVEDNRVVEINLPENNLTGSVPDVLNEVLGLRSLNLSNNAIEDLTNLTSLPNLALLDVSGNALGYDDLIPNVVIDGFIFNDQANFGSLNDQKLPQGSNFSLEYDVAGENNTYQWFLNNEPIDNANSNVISSDSLTFDMMGIYTLEVKNELINAVDPEFTLESSSVQIIATANISGSVADANDFLTESGQIYLFEYIEGQAFDSVLLDNNEFFEILGADGVFEIQNLALGDYVLYVDNNENEYPELLNTYFQNTIDWEVAEVISLRSNLQDLQITMAGEPQALNGTSNFSGYLEEEFEENSRVLPRRRVKKAGVSVRKLVGSSRDVNLKTHLQNGELVAYMETDENGEFSFPNLPAGRYSVKFDVPGVPMDEESDIIFELTGEDQESLEVSALSDNGKITVNKVNYTANKSELLSNVKVYPNPSTGSFRISITESISNIKVLSPEGRLIHELSGFTNQSQEVEIDLSDYPDGMYFMQIEWKDGVRSTNKLIKE